MQTESLPELKEIVGAMIFASKRPLTVRDIRRILKDTAADHPEDAAVFAEATPRAIREAIATLTRELAEIKPGFIINEVAEGFRLESKPVCGIWLRKMLAIDRPTRLSRPALETLAVIAYRQPVARAEIEAVRGVGVAHVIKALMEMQLVRITGRSELPGRPLLYGTTQLFLEHFGLKSIRELSEMEPMLLLKTMREQENRNNPDDPPPQSAPDNQEHQEKSNPATAGKKTTPSQPSS